MSDRVRNLEDRFSHNMALFFFYENSVSHLGNYLVSGSKSRHPTWPNMGVDFYRLKIHIFIATKSTKFPSFVVLY